MTAQKPLNCLKCPSLCCTMAGHVQVSRQDIRRLAKHLGLTVREFEEKHIVEVTRRGVKRIKSGFNVCQFLAVDRTCTVYKARPTDCRGYICWDQDDTEVYEYARFIQLPVATARKLARE
jgi:Fe-S-cluster containining protein